MNAARNTSGFIGQLSRLHLWDRALDGEYIEKMALNSSNDVGNLISWPKLVYNDTSAIKKITPSTAVDTGWSKLC